MSDYKFYKKRLHDLAFPYAVLDVDLFEKNIATNLKRAKDKKIRIASKSLRCEAAMRMILDYHSQFQGIMTYHAAEAIYLARQGFDDLLMGYPIVSASFIEQIGELVKQGKQICLMVDSEEHLQIIHSIGEKLATQIPICIDIDLSDNYPGLRFGVWRSSIQTLDNLEQFAKKLGNYSYVKLEGIMGYEAQIAGLGDAAKNDFLKNQIIKVLKNKSIKNVVSKRQKAVELLQTMGLKLRFVNGGGTGSLESTTQENSVTEVTVGSGFYNSHLFDNYQNFDLHPALFYGIEVVRKPNADTYTCHGGGFIASGGIEKIKAPIVHLPKGGSFDKNEGAGEVQTPIRFDNSNLQLQIGDPIYLRHAKAGELLERFNEVHFLKNDKIGVQKTYRGQGQSFG